jgi:hypothetical protein
MIGDMETERVEALRRYAVLDTPCEREFEELAALAAQICRTPLAAIGLMDAEREWFKATVGMSVTEVPRAKSLSAETIQQNDVLIVNDTLSDARFRDKFLVNGNPRIRFYAGAPLTTPSGHTLGTICVMDREPRTFGGGTGCRSQSSRTAGHIPAGVAAAARRRPNRGAGAEEPSGRQRRREQAPGAGRVVWRDRVLPAQRPGD